MPLYFFLQKKKKIVFLCLWHKIAQQKCILFSIFCVYVIVIIGNLEEIYMGIPKQHYCMQSNVQWFSKSFQELLFSIHRKRKATGNKVDNNACYHFIFKTANRKTNSIHERRKMPFYYIIKQAYYWNLLCKLLWLCWMTSPVYRHWSTCALTDIHVTSLLIWEEKNSMWNIEFNLLKEQNTKSEKMPII